MIHWWSKKITPDPLDMLWHYAIGEMPCYIDREGGEVGWLKYSHRGVQHLDKVEFPKSERRYIFSPKFEVRYNQNFEAVVTKCADLKRQGHTWITPDLIKAYIALHQMGFAHSYETYQNGKLVGGAFGIQIGGFITCDSMFHEVSNASKAAWGQTLVRLKERGFEWIDTNCVASHKVKYGEEWVPTWKFEQLMAEAMKHSPSLADDIPCRPIPKSIQLALPLARMAGKLRKKLGMGDGAVGRVQENPVGTKGPETAPAGTPAAIS